MQAVQSSPSPKAAPWPLHTAKAQLSALVESAARGKPQRITRRGKSSVVVLSESAFVALQNNAKRTAPDFVSFLLSIPKGSNDHFERVRVVPREITL